MSKEETTPGRTEIQGTIPFCGHKGIPEGSHSPDLQGCESLYLQDLARNYTNGAVGKTKQAIEMLGLPDKQERAAKKAISEILWQTAQRLQEEIWSCTQEGRSWNFQKGIQGIMPEPASYTEAQTGEQEE